MTTEDVFEMARRLSGRTPSEREIAARRASQAVRELGERLVIHDASAEVLHSLAEAVAALASTLPTMPGDSRYSGLADGAATVVHALETHAVGGPVNPFAIPLRTDIDEAGGVLGETSLGAAHEGTPGVVHGGFVAAIFDQLLGAAAAGAGRAMVTGTLNVRYKRPTPTGERLFFAARLASVEGRRLVVTGECVSRGEITAEAEAVFVTVDPGRYVRQ